MTTGHKINQEYSFVMCSFSRWCLLSCESRQFSSKLCRIQPCFFFIFFHFGDVYLVFVPFLMSCTSLLRPNRVVDTVCLLPWFHRMLRTGTWRCWVRCHYTQVWISAGIRWRVHNYPTVKMSPLQCIPLHDTQLGNHCKSSHVRIFHPLYHWALPRLNQRVKHLIL